MGQLSKERLARYQKKLEETQQGNRDKFIKLGKLTRVRVLPGINPGSDDQDWYAQVIQHYNAHPDSNVKTPVTCPKSRSPEARCPICERWVELKSGDTEDQAEAKNIRPQTKYFVGVVSLEEDAEGEVGICALPSTAFASAMELMVNPEYGDITDPETGTNLRIKKTGEGLKTRYIVQGSRQPSPLAESDAEIKEILAKQPDLARYRVAATAEAIQKFMDGEIDKFSPEHFPGGRSASAAAAAKKVEKPIARKAAVDEDEDDEEENKPRPVAAVAKPIVKKAAPKDEEDDDEDEPPVKAKKATPKDEDEDDAPPPAKVKKAAPVTKDEDEDEEDDPAPPVKVKSRPVAVTSADDEDEDEPPVKKGSKQTLEDIRATVRKRGA